MPETWTPPWREGLPKTLCPGCLTNVVETTTVRGHCRECVDRLGVVAVAEAPADPQLSLGL
jgi:hypothetical protein